MNSKNIFGLLSLLALVVLQVSCSSEPIEVKVGEEFQIDGNTRLMKKTSEITRQSTIAERLVNALTKTRDHRRRFSSSVRLIAQPSLPNATS